MANTITGLLPDIYEALDVISRELTGFIPAASRSSSVARAAIGQSVSVPIAPTPTTANNTPGVNAPDTGDQTITEVGLAITKSKHAPVRWNGEETLGLENAGTFSSIQADRFYQAMRVLVNEIETDSYVAAYTASSRAFGTAGTTPFATAGNMMDFAETLKILETNGAPTNDLQMVLGHSAMGNLRGKMSNLFKVNEAGSAEMLRNGMMDRIMNFAVRHSHAIGVHTKGTADANFDTNLGAPLAVGDKTIALDTGTGTILAGDVITFAGDTNNYVVNTALSGGSLAVGGPGLRQTLADGVSMTLGNSYTPNIAFARSALVLATRAPALPKDGDAATDRMIVTDPRTGLSFEIARYAQFLQVVYHVRMAWGVKCIKPEHVATLMG